jgi:hypothetical protein
MNQTIETREYCLYPKYTEPTVVKSVFADNENTNVYRFIGDDHFCNTSEEKFQIIFRMMKTGQFGKISENWDTCAHLKFNPGKIRTEPVVVTCRKLEKIRGYISPIFSTSGGHYETEQDVVNEFIRYSSKGLQTQWTKLIDYQTEQVVKDVVISWGQHGYSVYADIQILK